MECPYCGSRSLRIEVVFRGKVACDFASAAPDVTEEVALNSEWSENSECECASCGWIGTVGGARVGPPA